MATDTAVAEKGAGADGAGEKKARAGIYFQAPSELRERIDKEAAAVNKTPAVYVRDLLAAQWGITLPEAPTRKTYATPEEKAEAQRKARQDRQSLIKQLLAEHKAKMEQQKAA